MTKIKSYLLMFFMISAVAVPTYYTVAWWVFQWRNPLANEMSFYRNWWEVASWKKLPQYQPLP